jgi:hypothetical protein
MRPAPTPCVFILLVAQQVDTWRRHTQRMVVTRSQIIELATLARIWLAPSKYHNMYVVENNVVQPASVPALWFLE